MMDNNIIVQVSTNRQSITAVAAPSNVVLQGSSDIYVVPSFNALSNILGQTITLADDDKKTLDKLLSDGTRTAVIVDSGGNLSVRYKYVNIGALLIVFLVSNGKEETYIVGYQYNNNICRCFIKYKLTGIGDNDTVLTTDNWDQYITLPSGGSEWTKAENMADVNLFNAKELYVKLTAEGYEICYPFYIYCPDGLGANPYYYYYLTTYYGQSLEATGVYYDGSWLQCNGSLIIKEVWYKL